MNGSDPGRLMVQTGNAVDLPKYSGGYYACEQETAKSLCAAMMGRVGILTRPGNIPASLRHSRRRSSQTPTHGRALLAYDLGWTRTAIINFSGLSADEVERRLLGSEAASRAR